MGPLVPCFQDVLVHGQDVRSIRKTIRGINSDYQAKYTNEVLESRRARLGSGRILWIKARTSLGNAVNIINVYQATSKNPALQQRLYDAITLALNAEHDPCILLGDFNASIEGGRTNYARPGRKNSTTIADATFDSFVETTKGTNLPPGQAS